MRFETSLAIEEMKESIVQVLLTTCKPDEVEAAKEAIWELVDKVVECMRQDALLEAQIEKAKFVLIEFDLRTLALDQVVEFYKVCDKQVRSMVAEDKVDEAMQPFLTVFKERVDAVNSFDREASARRTLKERTHEEQVADAKIWLTRCREGAHVFARLLKQMLLHRIVSYEEIETTPEEIEQFLRQEKKS